MLSCVGDDGQSLLSPETLGVASVQKPDVQGLSAARVAVSVEVFVHSKGATDAVGGLSPAVEVFAEELKILVSKQITRGQGFVTVLNIFTHPFAGGGLK